MNTKGFSALEAILILVIIVIIGGLGWYIWNTLARNNDVPVSTDNRVSSAIKFAEYKIEIPVGMVSKDCSDSNDKTYLVSSSSDVAINCDDRDNIVLISEADNATELGCPSKSELAVLKQKDPAFVVESCEVTKGTYLGRSMTIYNGEHHIKSMTLFGDKKVIDFSYFANAQGTYPQQLQFEKIIQSIENN